MIIQFRSHAIEPEAHVSSGDIRKGANPFVKPTYLKLLVAGITIGINKCKEFTPESVNFRILILTPLYCLPDFTVSRTRASAQLYDYMSVVSFISTYFLF